ncbi:MAG: bifunctional diaminohydroxyphosphoribosylaminopyrimidine deaminase/5-amino-6-(5-phosphoribosylamino)uracil reductase RibD, partial [Elusimicrobia bacterium]|nr:bifunctional diaminohydroxyphosphoribosylaminopyrimidine deaminase/5-amino-6-(5-phosphoribosylamino)uracil reductase RibD [Elusimicrobiota bacterium]
MNDDEKWMKYALSLAEKGIGGASPNPLVGCVIVKNHRILGEGYHARFGGPHAEIAALRACNQSAKGATLYVNLEPCCHWGKTPPCTEAILRSGVKRVVVAIQDPNPLVKNKGLPTLKKSGLRVQVGTCDSQAKELNRSFIKYMTEKKPYVLLKSALSLDGKIATSSGQSQWISSSTARQFSYRMRTEVDAILVGAETVRKEDPQLTSHGLGRNPVRVVLSGSGRIPPKRKIFSRESPTWIYHSSRSGTSQRNEWAEWIYVQSKRGASLPFQDILLDLGKRGISKLLIEGGGKTAASALQSHAVDEIYFFRAPLLIGGRDAPTVFEGVGFSKISEAIKLD